MSNEMFTKYGAELKFRDKILGMIPKSEKLIEDWLATINYQGDKANQESIVEDKPVNETLEEKEKKSWCGFLQNGDGIYIRDYHVKANLKDSSKILVRAGIIEFASGKKQMVKDGLFVKPVKLYLKREGNTIDKVDGYDERPITVMGPRGPRTTLRRNDFIQNASVAFELWVVGNVITEKQLRTIFEFSGERGIGASRMEAGQYDLIELEKIS